MLNLNLTHLIDDAKCYKTVRLLRWESGVCCPKCNSPSAIERGKDETQLHRQRYQCKDCGTHFDHLTGTIKAGHHQPLRMWLLCLYLIGLNRSNQQIAQELELDKDVVQDMTTQLRQCMVKSKPQVQLSGDVECDRVYLTAGDKGNPEVVKKKDALDGATVSKGFGAGVGLKKRNRPGIGMIQPGGEVVIRMLENVQQGTIEPLVKAAVTGSLIYTDEYGIYNALNEWGYEHKSVCHGAGEYAGDDDGDGFCQVDLTCVGRFLVTLALLVASTSGHL